MKSIFLFLAILMASTSGFAKNIDTDFRLNATTFPDGVLLKANQPDMGFKLTVVGPEDTRFSKKYSASDPVFLGINSADGEVMPDGLYKYEARPVPAVSYTREESSKMPDRNSIKNTTSGKISPVSGTFRILNGSVIDPDLSEYGTRVSQEAAK